ncbi:MAG: aminotransferase class V-fold PLP-dependent enzyme [Chloroflexota bacterium]
MAEDFGAGFDVEALREQLPVLRDVVYLNSGTVGLTARPVLERLWQEVSLFESEGAVRYKEMQARLDAARARVAAFLGADADELAFTRNATDGVNLVAQGLDWREGDEVVISDEEHPAMDHPWHYLAARGGPRLRTFAVAPDPEQTLTNLRAALGPRTRLIACSHVSCISGTRLPAAAICDLARGRGILSFLDGAQAVGQFRVDVRALGCDFYTGNGHKWLHGPKGTGFLYLRRELLDAVAPVFVGAGSFEHAGAPNELRPVASAKRYEYGTRGYGAYAALPAAIDYLAGLGWDAVEARLAALAGYLKEKLRRLPGVTLLGPAGWAQSSALVSFSITGYCPEQAQTLLWERYRVRARAFVDRPLVRLSPAYFNNQADLDAALAAVRQMAAGG